MSELPERADVFFNDFWHRPIAMDLDLTMTPEEMKALLLDNVQELCRVAFKAGYKQGNRDGRLEQLATENALEKLRKRLSNAS